MQRGHPVRPWAGPHLWGSSFGECLGCGDLPGIIGWVASSWTWWLVMMTWWCLTLRFKARVEDRFRWITGRLKGRLVGRLFFDIAYFSECACSHNLYISIRMCMHTLLRGWRVTVMSSMKHSWFTFKCYISLVDHDDHASTHAVPSSTFSWHIHLPVHSNTDIKSNLLATCNTITSLN